MVILMVDIIEKNIEGLHRVMFENEEWFAFEMDEVVILFKETEDGRIKIQVEP